MLKTEIVYSVMMPIARFVLETKHPCAINVPMVISLKTKLVPSAQPTANGVLRIQFVTIVWMALGFQIIVPVSPV